VCFLVFNISTKPILSTTIRVKQSKYLFSLFYFTAAAAAAGVS
jgi:hypothetical protein